MSWRARLTPNINNMVVWINPKDPNCFGVRNWLRRNIAELKLLNPLFEISMQEYTIGEPVMYILYNVNDKRMVRLAGCTEDEFEDIMQAVVTYANKHVLSTTINTDDGNRLDNPERIISFGYTERFISRLENGVQLEKEEMLTFGVDDPGQEPRVLPRNDFFKYLPETKILQKDS